MADYPDPESRNVIEPDCSRCPALVECRERISWGNGSLDADVVVVGEAPAYGDPEADRWRGGNWTGMAYTSRHSGRVVRELFADAGFDADELYFTNAVKCFPADDTGSESGDADAPDNREPTVEERENCRDYLRTEIAQVDPAVVATTGRHATLATLGDDAIPGGFLDTVLDPVDSSALGATVLPLLHPSYQNVWLARLDYDREGYVAAIREAVAAVR